MDPYSRLSALEAAVNVLKHRVEIILPVLARNNSTRKNKAKLGRFC